MMENSVDENSDTSLLKKKVIDNTQFLNTEHQIDSFCVGVDHKNLQYNADTCTRLIVKSDDELTDNNETCNDSVKKLSLLDEISTNDTLTCNCEFDSQLEIESETELLNENVENVDSEICPEFLDNHFPFQSDSSLRIHTLTSTAADSESDKDIDTLQNINAIEPEINFVPLPETSHVGGEATDNKQDRFNTPTALLDKEKNDFSGKSVNADGDTSDVCSICSSLNDDQSDYFTAPIPSSFLLPSFDQIYDGDLETENNLPETDENFHTDTASSQIPDFEILQYGVHDTASISSEFGDRDVIDLLKEIQNDLISGNDNNDYGLAELFKDPQSDAKNSYTGGKSKSSRKRKKQQQKLRKIAPIQNKENSRRKFAQSFKELQTSQMVFDDHDIDSSITCPVCLEMFHMPTTCNPCSHMFCDPCLRRLTSQGSEGIPCPLCRTVISSCELNKDFDVYLSQAHPNIYAARALSERRTKFRHYQLPYTAPVPLGKRLLRQLIASRNNQSDTRWMSHDWFKFLLGCTAGMCLSLLIMLFNRVKSVRDARDVNIVFLSILIGASVTFLIFKYIRIQ